MINEAVLSKGHQRKLTALRKSLGKTIADRAFLQWQKLESKKKVVAKDDPIAKAILQAVEPALKDLNLGRNGYTVIRTGRGGTRVYKNTKARG